MKLSIKLAKQIMAENDGGLDLRGTGITPSELGGVWLP